MCVCVCGLPFAQLRLLQPNEETVHLAVQGGTTVAELGPEQKNQHSHRARSATLLRAMLADAWHLGS